MQEMNIARSSAPLQLPSICAASISAGRCAYAARQRADRMRHQHRSDEPMRRAEPFRKIVVPPAVPDWWFRRERREDIAAYLEVAYACAAA